MKYPFKVEPLAPLAAWTLQRKAAPHASEKEGRYGYVCLA